MTTKIKVASTDDISTANEVVNFSNVSRSSSHVLGATSWLADADSAYEAILMVLRFIYDRVLNYMPAYEIWLLMGTSAWQPNTSIVRHRKLWGALDARGICVSHVSNAQEHVIEVDGKLKYYGAVQISQLSLPSVAKALAEPCAYLIVVPQHFPIRDIIEMGWRGFYREDAALIDVISAQRGLVLRPLGEFDDPERGMLAIGSPDILRKIID